MNKELELQNRLEHIEQICKAYIKTQGLPKDVIMKHVIGIAKGQVKREDQ